jgi:hypothetical protein
MPNTAHLRVQGQKEGLPHQPMGQALGLEHVLCTRCLNVAAALRRACPKAYPGPASLGQGWALIQCVHSLHYSVVAPGSKEECMYVAGITMQLRWGPFGYQAEPWGRLRLQDIIVVSTPQDAADGLQAALQACKRGGTGHAEWQRTNKSYFRAVHNSSACSSFCSGDPHAWRTFQMLGMQESGVGAGVLCVHAHAG